MTPPQKPGLSEALAKLRARFLASSGATVDIFTGLASRLEAGPADADALETLQRELHRTHGTSGSYGFHTASRAAATLELVVARWRAEPGLDGGRRATIVRRFAEVLSRAFAGDSAPRRVLLVDVDDALVVPLVSEVLHRGYAAERIAAAVLAATLADDPASIAGILAGRDAAIDHPGTPGVTPAGTHGVTRVGAGDDAAAAITACCGPTP